jgi:endonuclease/exonuclease/phosphatase family metal-dependent hydrolase
MKLRTKIVLAMAIGVVLAVAIVLRSFLEKVPTGPAEADQFPGSFPATQPAGDVLHVATFNIDGGGEDPDLHGIADCIRGFDIVGLEEVHGDDYAVPADQADALAAAVNLPVVFCPVERQYWGEKTFGNALLTDLPVRHWKRIPISAADSDSNRNVILLHATFGGQDLYVLVTHIDRHQDHAPEIRSVSSLFLSQPSPAVMIGDFNCEPGDADIANLAATPGVGDPIGKGYDRIFVRGMNVIASGHTEHHVSDHPMAWAELRIQ